jgi:predicted RNA-binding Zn-ribbon protein involved in translation (DUF1610 family)
MNKLTRNAIRCKSCGDEIESRHVHDFRSCKCGKVSIDGGLAYARRLYSSSDHFEELSTYAEEPKP